jgi:hypothetical protein
MTNPETDNLSFVILFALAVLGGFLYFYKINAGYVFREREEFRLLKMLAGGVIMSLVFLSLLVLVS